MRSPRSYLLRIYRQHTRRQRTRIAGVAEDLRSGERHAFATLDELWEWLRRPLASPRRQRPPGGCAPPGAKLSDR
jgi:hypothetical protein